MENRTAKWIYQLPVIEEEFERLLGSDAPAYTEENIDKLYLDILRECCKILRNAEAEDAQDLDVLIQKLDDLFNDKVVYWFDELGNDTIKSFVDHEDECPLIMDEYMKLGQGLTDVFIKFASLFSNRPAGEGSQPPKDIKLPKLPETWEPSMKPHPKTTRLARLRPDHPPYSISESTPFAKIIYDARCEVQQNEAETASKLHLSSGSSVLAFLIQGVSEYLTPCYLEYFILDERDHNGTSLGEVTKELPLTEGVYGITTDESRKLIFAADKSMIKSYQWGPLEDKFFYRRPRAVHTLRTTKYQGPLFVTPDSRSIWRGGKNSLAIWNIEDLETHGPSGKDVIGGEATNVRRDEGDIEPSVGSSPHTTMRCIDSVNIGCWHPHPQIAGTMFCAAGLENDDDYRCSAVNFDQGGKIVARYLGHGGHVEGLSTSAQDPNVVVTACTDGFVRMFDLRRPLPVIMFSGSTSQDPCTSVLYLNPDGIPTIMSGQEKTERIMVWDVRARAVVYELSTGNNSVESLLFDHTRSTLYASASRPRTKYREANIPDSFKGNFVNASRWPRNAFHPENYFGYAYDAGVSSILQYEFKESPDVHIYPCSWDS